MRSWGWSSHDETSALVKRDRELGDFPSTMMGGRGGDTARRWLSASQEEGSHHNLTILAPRFQTSSLQNCERVKHLNAPAYDILQTNMVPLLTTNIAYFLKI